MTLLAHRRGLWASATVLTEMRMAQPPGTTQKRAPAIPWLRGFVPPCPAQLHHPLGPTRGKMRASARANALRHSRHGHTRGPPLDARASLPGSFKVKACGFILKGNWCGCFVWIQTDDDGPD